MKGKTFWTCVIIAALALAVMTLGGCGGGSNNFVQSNGGQGNGGGTDTAEEDVSLLSVRGMDDFDELISELTADGTMAKVSANNFYYFYDGMILSDYELDNVISKTPEQERQFVRDINDALTEELLDAYESGYIITTVQTTVANVNKMLDILGEAHEDESIAGPSGELDMYLITLRRTGGFEDTYRYVIPKVSDGVTATSDVDVQSVSSDRTAPEDGDTLESNGADEKAIISTTDYDMEDFQVDRWRSYFRWIASLPQVTNGNVSSSEQEVRAAADNDLTKIADAQTETRNFSYSGVQVEGVKFDGKVYDCMKFTKSRNNTMNYKIYSVHSFANGKDYYLVQSTLTTVPKNFTDTYVYPWGGSDFKFNYLYGYTRQAGAEHWINDGNMSVNDVALIRNIPSNVNKSTTYNQGTTWSVSGKVSVNKDGAAAEIGGGVQYSSSKSWTTTEYSIVNNSMKTYVSSAAWYADVSIPEKGSGHFIGLAPYRKYWGINAVAASTNQLQFDSEWIWEVGRDYWKANKDLTVNIKFWAYDGASTGESDCAFSTYSKFDGWFSRTSRSSFTLKAPAHMVINQTRFNFGSGSDHGTFYILSESDWTASSDSSWCIIADSTKSGTATGTTEQPIMIDVDPNTTGASRTAKITIKNTDGEEITFIATQAR